jgi:hypothetical protein
MRRLIGFVIVVALLLIGVDRAAWWASERGLAHVIQDSNHLSQLPDVKIEGFPFLTQALAGRYTQVDATVKDLSVQGGLTINRLDVQLRGVHVQARDLLNQRVRKAPVDSASAVASVSYASMDAAARANLPNDQLKVVFGEGRAGQVAVTGSYTSPLIKAQVDGQAQVVARSGVLIVGLLPDSLSTLPEPARSQVIALLGVSYKLPPLPFGFKAKSVTVGSSGVTIRAAADSVVLG